MKVLFILIFAAGVILLLNSFFGQPEVAGLKMDGSSSLIAAVLGMAIGGGGLVFWKRGN